MDETVNYQRKQLGTMAKLLALEKEKIVIPDFVKFIKGQVENLAKKEILKTKHLLAYSAEQLPV